MFKGSEYESTEQEFYKRAATFWDFTEFLERNKFPDATTQLQCWVQQAAGTIPSRRVGLRIDSEHHQVDWSLGGNCEGRVIDLQKAAGTLQGTFIGYFALNHCIEGALEPRPTLATVIAGNVRTPDTPHYIQALIVTPIPGATIECLSA
jgi:hypothetical protein